MQEIAQAVGANDLFVLRRIAPDRLFNTDGFGRGFGWAGNVSIDPGFEPWIAEAFTQQIHRRSSGVPFRAFGPYWATDVAAIPKGDDLVIFGGKGIGDTPDEALIDGAEAASSTATAVTSEKQDADEAEVQQALAELTGVTPGPVAEMASHLATVTARALSCEFGAVLLTGPPMKVFMADEGWRPTASEDEVIAALTPLLQVSRNELYVEQDISESPFPYRPLSFDDGLVARCVVPIGPDASLGVLVAAHAGSAPRGFTMLCQRVARTMAEAGAPLIESAQSEG